MCSACDKLLHEDQIASKAGNTPTNHRSPRKHRTLAALLLCAQEAERSRIARELHDDVAQQLALIFIDINRIRSSGTPEGTLSALNSLETRVKHLATRVRTLSHDLHSPELDLLGLGSAISIFCREFGEAHRIEVTCDYSGLPGGLPKDISLCLYRITQEALQNMAKHSGAVKASVKLRADDDGILLRIQDFGCGFQLDRVGNSSRMGLRSMRERTRSVGGSIAIQSKLGEGTTIEVRVRHAAQS